MKKFLFLIITLLILTPLSSCQKKDPYKDAYSINVEATPFGDIIDNHYINKCQNSHPEYGKIELAYDYDIDSKLMDIELNYTNENVISNERHFIIVDNTLNALNYRDYIDESSLILDSDFVYVPAFFEVKYQNKNNETIVKNINKYTYSSFQTFIFETEGDAKNLEVKIKFQIKSDDYKNTVRAYYYNNEQKWLLNFPYEYYDKDSYLVGHLTDKDYFEVSRDYKTYKVDYKCEVEKVDDYYLNHYNIELTANKLKNETKFFFYILNGELFTKESYYTFDGKGNTFLKHTTVSYEYTLDNKVISEKIDNYRLNGHYDYKIDLSFPKGAMNLKININSNIKKTRKIVNYIDGICCGTL